MKIKRRSLVILWVDEFVILIINQIKKQKERERVKENQSKAKQRAQAQETSRI